MACRDLYSVHSNTLVSWWQETKPESRVVCLVYADGVAGHTLALRPSLLGNYGALTDTFKTLMVKRSER